MKRTIAGVRRAQGRPVWQAALAAILAILVFAACDARGGLGASESWSGVAIQPQENGASAFIGTRDGRIVELVLRPNSRGLIQATQGSVFDVNERTEGRDTRSRVGGAFYGTPTVANGRVYAGSYQGFIYSMLAAGTGQGVALSGVRSFEIDGDNLSKGIAGDVIYHDGLLVVTVAEDINRGRLYVLNADRLDAGASAVDVERCRYPAGHEDGVGRMWTTPLVVDGIAYFGDLDHQLHAVDIDTCRPVWSSPVEMGGGVVATPTALNGKLYVGAFDRIMYAVDMATGSMEELFEAKSWFWASAATNGSMLYAPNLDGVLYAYDLASSSLAWQYNQEGDPKPVLSDPAVVNNNVVMASDSGKVIVVNDRGNRIADFAIPNDRIRAPISVQGNTVYVRTLDELVTAFVIVNNGIERDWQFQLQGF